MLAKKIAAKSSRRAQIESHFSWIFVLIAGAVILAFFFSVAQKQRDLSNQKLSISFVSDFEAIISSAAVAKGTTQSLPIYNQELDFSCGTICDCKMAVGGFSKQFRDKIIFAPQQISGRNMILWTLDWKDPFRIANFLYLTDDNTQYWFVGDEPTIKTYIPLDKLPASMKYTIVQSPESISSVAKKNRVVFFHSAASDDVAKIQNIEGVSALWITAPSSLLFRWGAGLDKTFTTATYESLQEKLLGAIFSEEGYLYDCQAQVADARKSTITEVYTTRAANLIGKASAEGCDAWYSNVVSSQNFVEANQKLLGLSCPTIY
jgi:hypothetical protein